MKKTYKVIYRPDTEPKYNVKLFNNGWYCGNGRFCKDKKQVEEYKKIIEQAGYTETILKD